jgi:small-conductance mechanosensitive channel
MQQGNKNVRSTGQQQRTTGRRTSARPKPARQVKRRRGASRRRTNLRDPASGARSSLRQFRQASILAVVFTGFLLLMLDAVASPQDPVQNGRPDTVHVIESHALDELAAEQEEEDPLEDADLAQTADQALDSVKGMLRGFLRLLPRLLVAIGVVFIFWALMKGVNFIVRRALGHWERTEGITTLVAMVFWFAGIGLALSILAGDIRALIGSLGLVGLALSWALQSPIESGTGWLLNKFKGYYRVGDRIVVANVFGDVYKIDFINTTLWEVGDPFGAGFVSAEQPTGRLVTFPNSEILNGTVVNLTSDYPYVWDELSNQVGNESDMSYALEVIGRVANELLGEQMKGPATEYGRILRKAGLEQSVSDKPQLFLASMDSWTDVVVRYLVPARERRKWKSDLLLRITEELNKPEHQEKIIGVYPRQQVQMIDPDGRPAPIAKLVDR